jgi:CheY-like chemotaxis protein
MSEVVNLTGKKILVVEDDDMNFLYLSQIFKMTHGEIIRAKYGKLALELAQNNRFDIILMDIQLPDITGIDVTRLIRKFNPTVPIIAQTASRTPEETDFSLDWGCTDILVKPFTINDFSRMLKKYI